MALNSVCSSWANFPERPTPQYSIIQAWDDLIQKWCLDERLPLLIRQSRSPRGVVVSHVTGRCMVPVDNSTAVWVFAQAIRKITFTVQEIAELLQRDQIPIAMVLKTSERNQARYRCKLQKADNLNQAGWYVAHKKSVGLNTSKDLTTIPLQILVDHFRAFLSPANMFLVPKELSGLGELPEMITAVSLADKNRWGFTDGADSLTSTGEPSLKCPTIPLPLVGERHANHDDRQFPLCVQKLSEEQASRLKLRRWIFNDASNRIYSCAVPITECPCNIRLSWKRDADAQVHLVGYFRLDLKELLDKGFIREDSKSGYVRVNMLRDDRGRILLQVSSSGPEIVLGEVKGFF